MCIIDYTGAETEVSQYCRLLLCMTDYTGAGTEVSQYCGLINSESISVTASSAAVSGQWNSSSRYLLSLTWFFSAFFMLCGFLRISFRTLKVLTRHQYGWGAV